MHTLLYSTDATVRAFPLCGSWAWLLLLLLLVSASSTHSLRTAAADAADGMRCARVNATGTWQAAEGTPHPPRGSTHDPRAAAREHEHEHEHEHDDDDDDATTRTYSGVRRGRARRTNADDKPHPFVTREI